jgi:FkbM family methyltransferase
MPSNKYLFKLSPKTRILNFFRRVLTIPVIEDFIMTRSHRNPSKFWMKVVPPEYTYPRGSIRNVERDGVRFCLDISDNLQHSIYFFGLLRSGFEFAEKDMARANVILDVGANIGTASIIASNINPRAEIHAFEPHPWTYRCASDIQKLNHISNVHFHNIGFGEKSGRVRLYEVNENNAGMNRVITGEQDFPYIEIEIRTMDEFVESQNFSSLDFVKIDVEGFEYSVLKGGAKSLRKYMPVLYIELDDNNLRDCKKSAKEVVDLIRSFGYNSISRADTGNIIGENESFNNCHYDIIARP